MIVQSFLNFWRDVILNWFAGLPPIPADIQGIVNSTLDAAQSMSDTVDKLSPLIPFGHIATIIGLWQVMILFWFGILFLRFVTWAVGR